MPMPFSSSSRPSTRTRSSSVTPWSSAARSEEHTSELQSLAYLVCRLLLEKKKQIPKLYSVSIHQKTSSPYVIYFGFIETTSSFIPSCVVSSLTPEPILSSIYTCTHFCCYI